MPSGKDKLKKGILVRLKWMDSCGAADAHWHFKDFMKSMSVSGCVSVGWVFSVDDRQVVLHSSYGDGNYGGVMAIPLVAIKKVTVL